MVQGLDYTTVNPIVNSCVYDEDEQNRDAGIARYTSTVPLLMSHMEDEGSRVWTRRRRAVLDVWLGWLAALLKFGLWWKIPFVVPSDRWAVHDHWP